MNLTELILQRQIALKALFAKCVKVALGVGLIAFLAILASGGFASKGQTVTVGSPSPPTLSMAECMEDWRQKTNADAPLTAAGAKELANLCYSILTIQGELVTFNITKDVYDIQSRSNIVLLWMVVIITTSGVALAGLQLVASYKLAAAYRTNLATSDELTLKRDEIVLKSSVTGLFILVVSFAFFLVFVFYVYKFDDPQKPSQTPKIPTIEGVKGGLGVAPSPDPAQLPPPQ